MTQDNLSPPIEQTKAVEDFLKAVYVLQQRDERASTNALREALRITAPSVTDMAKRLTDSGLIDYQKYKGVRLTDKGERVALQVLRRHRLIELYLVQELGYELHEVHEEAENLEHVVSDRFIEAISAKLDHPNFDPHGDPIPTAEGTLGHARELCPLSDLPLHSIATVSRYITSDPDMLQHTLDRGFALGTQVEVIARDPFDGPLTIKLNSDEIMLGHIVATTILVEQQT